MKYRKFLSLTDEEIIFIVSNLLDAKKVCNIKRHTNTNSITCDATTGDWEVDNKLIDIEDTITLSIPSFNDEGFTTHDFELDEKELWLYKQWLLSKGCDERLKKNPFLMDEEPSKPSKLESMFIGILNLKENANKHSSNPTWFDGNEQFFIFVDILVNPKTDKLYINMGIQDIDTNETMFDCNCDYYDNNKIIKGCKNVVKNLKKLEKSYGH